MPRPSAIPARARAWLLLVYWALMYLVTHLPGIDEWRPRGGWPIRDPDKYVHFFAFAGWVLVWAWLLEGHGRRVGRSALIVLFLGGAVYAAFDELTQGLVGRTPDWIDWVMDIAGLIAGVIIVFVHRSRRAARLPAPVHSRERSA